MANAEPSLSTLALSTIENFELNNNPLLTYFDADRARRPSSFNRLGDVGRVGSNLGSASELGRDDFLSPLLSTFSFNGTRSSALELETLLECWLVGRFGGVLAFFGLFATVLFCPVFLIDCGLVTAFSWLRRKRSTAFSPYSMSDSDAKTKPFSATPAYFFVIAIVDVCLLTSSVLLHVSYRLFLAPEQQLEAYHALTAELVPYLFPIQCWLQMASSYLTLLVLVERQLFLRQGFYVRNSCTQRLVAVLSLVTLALLALYNGPRFFEFEAVRKNISSYPVLQSRSRSRQSLHLYSVYLSAFGRTSTFRECFDSYLKFPLELFLPIAAIGGLAVFQLFRVSNCKACQRKSQTQHAEGANAIELESLSPNRQEGSAQPPEHDASAHAEKEPLNSPRRPELTSINSSTSSSNASGAPPRASSAPASSAEQRSAKADAGADADADELGDSYMPHARDEDSEMQERRERHNLKAGVAIACLVLVRLLVACIYSLLQSSETVVLLPLPASYSSQASAASHATPRTPSTWSSSSTSASASPSAASSIDLRFILATIDRVLVVLVAAAKPALYLVFCAHYRDTCRELYLFCCRFRLRSGPQPQPQPQEGVAQRAGVAFAPSEPATAVAPAPSTTGSWSAPSGDSSLARRRQKQKQVTVIVSTAGGALQPATPAPLLPPSRSSPDTTSDSEFEPDRLTRPTEASNI